VTGPNPFHSLQYPTYLSPFAKVSVPAPCSLPFSNAPTYLRPLANVYIPCPQNVPFLYSPTNLTEVSFSPSKIPSLNTPTYYLPDPDTSVPSQFCHFVSSSPSHWGNAYVLDMNTTQIKNENIVFIFSPFFNWTLLPCCVPTYQSRCLC